MLLVPQTAAAASMVLCVVLRFSCFFLALLVVVWLCCIVWFCLSHLRGGHDTSFYLFILFVSLSLSLFSVIAWATLLTALQCSISVSWFCDYRACISLGGRMARTLGVSNPTEGAALLGWNVSERLSSTREELPVSNDNLTSIMVLALVHGNIGRVARQNFFEVTFRVRFWAPHVKSSEKFPAPLPWDASCAGCRRVERTV